MWPTTPACTPGCHPAACCQSTHLPVLGGSFKGEAMGQCDSCMLCGEDVPVLAVRVTHGQLCPAAEGSLSVRACLLEEKCQTVLLPQPHLYPLCAPAEACHGLHLCQPERACSSCSSYFAAGACSSEK